jgi:pantoate--beta-alanine ligase
VLYLKLSKLLLPESYFIVMEIVRSIQEFKQKRFQGNFYSRPGVVIIHDQIHLGVETVIWKMIKSCDLRILVLLPNCNESFDDWKRKTNLDQIKNSLKIFNLDFLFIPDFSEKDYYSIENFKIEPKQAWTGLLEGSFMQNYAEQNLNLYLNLYNLVQPKHLFVGQKDYLLARLLSDMIFGFGLDLELHVVESVRNQQGVLYSGCFGRLSEIEKPQAEALNRTLEFIKRMILNNKRDLDELESLAKEFVSSFSGFRLKKIHFLNAYSLDPVTTLDIEDPILLAVMGQIGSEIFIDNVVI